MTLLTEKQQLYFTFLRTKAVAAFSRKKVEYGIRVKAATALAHLSHSNSVCLSVRTSHGWISQKWCKL